jgi:stage V sporulation protein B
MGGTVLIIHSKLLETNVNMWINLSLSILMGAVVYFSVAQLLRLPYIEDLKKMILRKN